MEEIGTKPMGGIRPMGFIPANTWWPHRVLTGRKSDMHMPGTTYTAKSLVKGCNNIAVNVMVLAVYVFNSFCARPSF